jgi:hypothetical protein
MDSDLLFSLDAYRGEGQHRSQLIHEAVCFYVSHLEQTGVRSKRWISR